MLLFNVITALLIDTFSLLRENEERRVYMLKNECFMCSLTREEYDNNNVAGPAFDQHVSRVHNMWNYVLCESICPTVANPTALTPGGAPQHVLRSVLSRALLCCPAQDISYLKDKDKTDYNGLESFVDSCIAANDMSWIPDRKTSGLTMGVSVKNLRNNEGMGNSEV